MKILFKYLILLMTAAVFVGCLQTRSGSQQQSQVYRKKNIENQNAEVEAPVQKIDERDELIRTLNGRVESLENQIQGLQKDKQTALASGSPDSQKIILLQDALAKMELQIQKLEGTEKLTDKSNLATAQAPPTKSSDTNLNIKKSASTKSETNPAKKQTPFEIAEEHFQKKEWKKAILSYQAYVEEFPKGKSVPEAKYKIGVCFQELGLKDEASAFYEEVLAQYPKSESGKKSKIRLAALKSKKAVK